MRGLGGNTEKQTGTVGDRGATACSWGSLFSVRGGATPSVHRSSLMQRGFCRSAEGSVSESAVRRSWDGWQQQHWSFFSEEAASPQSSRVAPQQQQVAGGEAGAEWEVLTSTPGHPQRSC